MPDNQMSVVVTTKPWWESKTLWFNGLTMAAALLVLIMEMSTAGTLPFPIDARWIVFAQALINFTLRFISNSPLTGGK